METSLILRNKAIENINSYCKKYNCKNEFTSIKNELIKKSDNYILKNPVDFYLVFYNLTTKLDKYTPIEFIDMSL